MMMYVARQAEAIKSDWVGYPDDIENDAWLTEKYADVSINIY
jgi:hypothetical protein